MLGRTIWHRHK